MRIYRVFRITVAQPDQVFDGLHVVALLQNPR